MHESFLAVMKITILMKEQKLLMNPCTYVILNMFADFNMAHCVNMQLLLTESESPFISCFVVWFV